MYAQIHYSEEFYCASLCRGDDEDLSQLLGDASRRGFSLQSPDINLSNSSWAIEGDKMLRAGFDAIRGISLTTSEAIVAARTVAGGKFESFVQFYEAVPKRSVNIAKVRQLLLAGSFDSLLSKIKRNKMYLFIEREKRVSSDDTELAIITDSDAEALQIDLNTVFNYELSSNYYQYHRKLIELLSTKLTVVKLDILKGTSREQRGQEAEVRYFIGKFDSIKYGYRAKVEKVGQAESKGFSSDLGGVYGILRDDTWSSYASFSGKLYRRPEIKGRVEECAGKHMLLRTDSLPWGVANIFIQDLFFMDDIKMGQLAPSLDLRGVLIDTDNGVCLELSEELKKCTACKGREACRRPTPFSTGILNVMIIGEAPGAEEEESGVPFVGKAGKILWSSLERHNLCREMFHITNVLKCRPKDNKIAEAQPAVDACKDLWLAAEIEVVKPRVILSLGKTATQVMSGDAKASIMEKTGTIEWSERYGAWIVYGLHPASVLYSPQNQALFDIAIDVFALLLGRLL
jgi:uracil-DNA glycosylase family 4